MTERILPSLSENVQYAWRALTAGCAAGGGVDSEPPQRNELFTKAVGVPPGWRSKPSGLHACWREHMGQHADVRGVIVRRKCSSWRRGSGSPARGVRSTNAWSSRLCSSSRDETRPRRLLPPPIRSRSGPAGCELE